MTGSGQAPLLHAVSDRRRLAPAARTTADEIQALEAWLDGIVASGVDVVQVRERDLDARVLHGLVERAVQAAAGRPARVVVNDRADVALATAASGVHLPAHGLPADRIRSIAPAHWLLGRSVHDAEAAGDAGPVDYLYFGTVFPSASKPGLAGGAGVDALAAMAAATPLPVIAIGGITAANAGACIEAGAAGVAAIGWFVPSRSAPGGRARELAARVASVRASMSRDR